MNTKKIEQSFLLGRSSVVLVDQTLLDETESRISGIAQQLGFIPVSLTNVSQPVDLENLKNSQLVLVLVLRDVPDATLVRRLKFIADDFRQNRVSYVLPNQQQVTARLRIHSSYIITTEILLQQWPTESWHSIAEYYSVVDCMS